MDRGEYCKEKVDFWIALFRVDFEDVIIRDKNERVLGYVNNEDISMISTKLYHKQVKETYKSKNLSTKPGRLGKEIIIITLAE